MAKLNVQTNPYRGSKITHEGGPAYQALSSMQELRRSVLACLLWEREFYESGQSIADRISDLASKVPPEDLAALAVEARSVHNLRHAPLLLLDVLTKTGAGKPGLVASTIEKVIQRADEPGELLSIYWRGGKKPLSGQIKKGLARAVTKFDAYELAKYNRDASVKLRDVLFMTHAKPKDEAQDALWKQLIDGTLASPDTWEVALSSGADKKATWERLLSEGKLGYLAVLRNLRNMLGADVDKGMIEAAIRARKGARRVLPFRYVAAARAAPQLEPAIDDALCASIGEMTPLAGNTIVLVDVSGSMDAPLSAKSDLRRIDAAAALASIWPGAVRVMTFSNAMVEVPPRRGMAGVDAVIRSQPHQGTYLGQAVSAINKERHDRLVVITDEQSADQVPGPSAKHAYMINVASARNGVGYGRWTHIDGFSESVIRWVAEFEKQD
jgi:60 kDa SS-A/Ro ribonucleoprotein